MWIYAQKTGQILRNGTQIGQGYSGAGDGKNDPAMQAIHDVGPIPQGDWEIIGIRLTTDTFGRDGFLIHGDNRDHTASQGCIIMGRDVREEIWNSGDRDLQVVAEF